MGDWADEKANAVLTSGFPHNAGGASIGEWDDVVAAIASALREERERCAGICYEHSDVLRKVIRNAERSKDMTTANRFYGILKLTQIRRRRGMSEADERDETTRMLRSHAKLLRHWAKWELGQEPVPEPLDHLHTARLLEDAAAWIENDIADSLDEQPRKDHP